MLWAPIELVFRRSGFSLTTSINTIHASGRGLTYLCVSSPRVT